MNSTIAQSFLISFILLLLISLSSCAQIQAQSRVDPQTIANYFGNTDTAKHKRQGRSPDSADPKKIITEQVDAHKDDGCDSKILKYDSNMGSINLDCFRFPDHLGVTAYELASISKEYRNRLAFVLIKQSNDVCTIEEGRLVADEAIVNTLLSTLDSIFSATSTVVSGQKVKSIFSGLATVANAERGHVNAEIYRNALTPSITKAIDGARDAKKASIITMFSKDLNSYPVDQMISDVNEYHQLCSLYKGLALVELAVDRATVTQSDRLDAARSGINIIDLRLTKMRALLKSDGISSAETTTINKQIDDLTQQQTELFRELINLQTATGKADSSLAKPQP